ncbi:RNA/RNP complex-1-interacting phosphatase [Cephus cinctus]|uniref:RNA/RNP complex-1-interacting phosphatase n=1 Tax=Cephus cinctus TaxID=211228 RepID=A0AAJ7FQ80_CEPCN|nr:RNA/RNP complex-1-interacting phosphatase [Cephus cinctus]
MPRSVPQRWHQYKAFGEVIKGTRIVAFKVPLKEGVTKHMQPEQRFTTSLLLQAFPRLKCVIDLTDSDRYYDRKDIINAGVTYRKIYVTGRVIPQQNCVNQFFKVMDDFASTGGPDDLIGVHCTHGVNRTGYMICRYLVQQLGWEYQDALKAFQEARGYPIERENYVESLKQVPRGEKIDTSHVVLVERRNRNVVGKKGSKRERKRKPNTSSASRESWRSAPTSYQSSRRGFPEGSSYQQPYPFDGAEFGLFAPMMPPLPPPSLSAVPSLPPPRIRHRSRPSRYGAYCPSPGPHNPPAILPPMPPPGPSYHCTNYHPRHSTLRVSGPPRLIRPPSQPSTSLGSYSSIVKYNRARNDGSSVPFDSAVRRPVNRTKLRNRPNDQDFTVDTFEENLTATLPPNKWIRGCSAAKK